MAPLRVREVMHGFAEVQTLWLRGGFPNSCLARDRSHPIGHQLSYTAGRITDGSATVEDVGWELFRLMLEVASGRRKTWAEQWKLRNALVLFNPASVT